MRLALLLCLLGAVSTFARQPSPPQLEDAVQDKDGILWAYGHREFNRVYRFDGKQWTEQKAALGPHDHALPEEIVRMTDGTVACIWRLTDKDLAVTRHTDKAVLLGTCDGALPETGLTTAPLADSQNRLWITGRFARIYRVDARGVSVAHEITPDELDAPSKAQQGYNGIHAVEDGKGRIWAWSESYASNYASLRGVLLFTGEKCELHDLTSTLGKRARILAMARADDHHLWAAVDGKGICRLDIDSFALEPFPGPSPRDLWRVHELFIDGGDLYAVEDTARSETALWRLRETKWTQVLTRLDSTYSHDWLPRSWLAIDAGLIVESNFAGPWFIPRQGEPAQYSWHCGLPLEGAHAFSRFADGTFFAIGHGGQPFHDPLPLPPHEQENPRIASIQADSSGWTLDTAGRPWVTLMDSPGSISEWDGEKWAGHPIPSAEKWTWPADILADAEGRMWVNPDTDGRDVHVITTTTGQWQNFTDLQAAYLALRDHPPHFPDNRLFVFDPQYSADRQRAAYRRGVVYLFYYDGSTWRRFERSQITGKDNDNALGPPWFDPEGNLCVNFRDRTTWQMNTAGQWSQVAFHSRFPTDIWSENSDNRTSRVNPPKGCVTTHPDSIVMDNLGTYWLTWQQALYRCIPGRCVKVFGADEVNPFRSTRELSRAFVDPRGNAFLLTSFASTEAFIIKPLSAPPHTVITIDPVRADAVNARLHAAVGSPTQFRWRLDEEPWQSTGDDTLVLDDLPNGSHRLSVSALDAGLQLEAPPAMVTFEIKVDPDRQIAGLCARLSDPDYERRKAAVNALALQPDRAMPALRRARETADNDGCWWIDAALQKIETIKGGLPIN